MTREQQAVYISTRVACALIEMEALKIENQERAIQNMPPAYNKEDFLALIDDYGIHHNAVVSTFCQFP